MPTFNYSLDDEPQHTDEHVLTAKQIMMSAEPPVDPDTHYLVQLIGKKEESYKDNSDQEIHMHQKMVFITVSTGPTTVSLES